MRRGVLRGGGWTALLAGVLWTGLAVAHPFGGRTDADLRLLCPLSEVSPEKSSSPLPAGSGVRVGMTDTAAYFPLLRGRRVAVLANQTSVAELPGVRGASGAAVTTDGAGRVHLVDLLHESGFDVEAIFSPEHGFRGTADAGEKVAGSVDARTGIPIRSLYDGRTLRPSDETMRSFDVLVVDMQDVGLRFYTYYIAMLRMMEACADYGHEVIVLDRPNPHGEKIDGPLLDMRYASGVGALPIPVLHGLTMGEIARMAVGEGWCAPCRLTVVACRNYAHVELGGFYWLAEKDSDTSNIIGTVAAYLDDLNESFNWIPYFNWLTR